jgi:hypothetical protein
MQQGLSQLSLGAVWQHEKVRIRVWSIGMKIKDRFQKMAKMVEGKGEKIELKVGLGLLGTISGVR